MEVGLRTHHSASLRVAIAEGLPEAMHEATREILSVKSSNPRKGHATALMWSVCTEADRAGITLIVMPKQFDDGMADEKLAPWYEKFGFVMIQTDPMPLMARCVEPSRIARVH